MPASCLTGVLAATMATSGDDRRERQGGSISEYGLIMDLLRCGFSIFTSLCELIANVYDKGGNRVGFIVDPMCTISDNPMIYIVDDACGMTIDDLDKKLCCLLNENHFDEQTSGISGKGGKAAMLVLGKKSLVTVYSKKNNEYSKAIIPYDKICNRDDSTQWTNGIIFSTMTEDEIKKFNKLRKIHNISQDNSGTVVEIQYFEDVHDIILKNFVVEERKKLFPCDRFDVVFGNQITNPGSFSLYDYSSGLSEYTIEPYNYLHGARHEYYNGRFENRIDVYQKSNDIRYIWIKDDQDESKWEELKKDKRGWRKKPTRAGNLCGYKKIGEFILYNGIRKDANFFNEENPKNYSKPKNFGEYNDKFYDSKGEKGELSEHISQCALVRNSQRVNRFPIDGFKASSARASRTAFAKICLFMSELEYSVTCTQDNIMDKLIGIQSNKNQINHQDFPVQLMRLISHIKDTNWNIIEDYFANKIKKHKEKMQELRRLENEVLTQAAVNDLEEGDNTDDEEPAHTSATGVSDSFWSPRRSGAMEGSLSATPSALSGTSVGVGDCPGGDSPVERHNSVIVDDAVISEEHVQNTQESASSAHDDGLNDNIARRKQFLQKLMDECNRAIEENPSDSEYYSGWIGVFNDDDAAEI